MIWAREYIKLQINFAIHFKANEKSWRILHELLNTSDLYVIKLNLLAFLETDWRKKRLEVFKYQTTTTKIPETKSYLEGTWKSLKDNRVSITDREKLMNKRFLEVFFFLVELINYWISLVVRQRKERRFMPRYLTWTTIKTLVLFIQQAHMLLVEKMSSVLDRLPSKSTVKALYAKSRDQKSYL